ncbi:MFS transporter [Brevibacillus porteri]|uniref:MFS transporter n=1 Tax=Brevibacillus porteri TaxID=2126350 RepID=A0ABX5FVI8_9BACL|nr:MFS transporter [Brevibacillus porteri]MED1801574.1 MFS transporter [Brevibacillus porteri]MED2133511.1 MFS transporter [Brevibacillus porteri]MED2743747.1 MFS transporter [Brevibacillus porteri]MED2816408.1 MFS transporter [Brevibacillus porteri]MED2893452.1 MFS transporter [Brevibacillus porteri]
MYHHPTTSTKSVSGALQSDSLPWSGLLALAMAGFVCILTETIPAGLLLQISEGLGVSEVLAGQLVTLYALGSLSAAIPLTAATRGWRRRPLLLMCILGFFIFNSITTLSSSYTLTLVARFFAGVSAGVSAGVLWGMITGYARRMVQESLKERAMAVAMVGTPLALALGVPAGTFLGALIGWRFVFGIMSLLALMLVVWVLWKLPDYPGENVDKRLPLHQIFVIPGVRPVLFVVITWVLAHNILYTYIAPYLAQAGLSERIDWVLLIFGMTSLVGIWGIGVLIGRKLRPLVLISLTVFAMASVILGIGSGHPIVIYLMVALRGLTFGGAATLLQTALADAAGKSANVAQSMLVTAWNLAIGGGGMLGGVLIEIMDPSSLPWALFILLILALLVAWRASKHGFPSK